MIDSRGKLFSDEPMLSHLFHNYLPEVQTPTIVFNTVIRQWNLGLSSANVHPIKSMVPFDVSSKKIRERSDSIASLSIPRQKWNSFLKSSTFIKPESHYFHALNDKDRGYQSAAMGHLLSDFQRALTIACRLWDFVEEEEMVFLDGNRANCSKDIKELKQRMWSTIVFLVKGTFFVKNNRPLTHLANEKLNNCLLHAATDVLSSCYLNDNDEDLVQGGAFDGLTGSTSSLVVFRKILERHPDQLLQTGPFLKRLPIHIAAANPFYRNSQQFQEDPGCSFEILEAILSKCPAHVASRKDATGSYPLLLALQSGYSWSAGLEQIFRMAPYVTQDRNSPSLVIVAAETSSLNTLFELLKVAPYLIFSR